jgi:thioredoxin-related protein
MKFLLLFFFAGFATGVFAQQDTIQPAYKRYPVIPGLQLFLSDSSKYTNENLPRKKQVLLMLYSPDCDHCQHEAEQIAARKDDLRDTHIIMATTFPIIRMNEFAAKYGLNKMENVVMAKDPYYILLSFYAIRNFPYMALYDKKGKLIRTYEGSVGIDKVLQTFRTAR